MAYFFLSFSRRRSFLIVLPCVLILLTLCGTSTESPTSYPPDAIIVENKGQLCFTINSMIVQGYFRPQGCFSSSCTRTLERTVTTRIFPEKSMIVFYARVVLEPPSGRFLCTTDCNGAGTVPFSVGWLDSGSYSIWLGNDSLGVLHFPLGTGSGQDSCLGEWL